MQENLNPKILRSKIFKSIIYILLSLVLVSSYIINYSQDINIKKYNSEFDIKIHKAIDHTIKHNEKNYQYSLQRLTKSIDIKQ
ncbi:MAG: hypothetical protein U9R37_01290 [Campylobacterota bacterium]|nr:hypothetical protein [Campylobacterota bacterium]